MKVSLCWMPAALALNITQPTGLGRRPIHCGNYLQVRWNAASVPQGTDCVRLQLVHSGGKTMIADCVPASPGFAAFYPWRFAGPLHVLIESIDKEGLVLDATLSDQFLLPSCIESGPQ
ncbi:hypothetical protein PSACC_03401 [Paramicrosporidium saccamoebae]|uniref:Uncharacterized protein n=1 Tax=Paramicrosporidium saccamoebae TaxID=1246581 RepID=A0A2H9TGD5_9FUNG|nr:hypothetical protein PSACC_03401 [Paramicrosporidium saccamoebae]